MEAPLPAKEEPVIAPAENSPDTPRNTIVAAPLEDEAVVRAFAIVPEEMLEALILVPPEISPITAAVTVLAEKLPPESRETIVDAPLELDAVVRALAMVPELMLEALIAVIAVPSPLKDAAETTLAPKLPLASRKTMVLALFDELAVVRALDMVPLVMFEALMFVAAAALPEMLVNEPVVAVTLVELTSTAVITLAEKEPLASRATIVEAPLAEDAVVLAFASVPVVIAEALIGTVEAAVN
jgi:hypothetical protein